MTGRYFTEEELLEALQNHDERAIKHVYAVNWPMIRNMVLTNSGNEEDAKDLYQESIVDFLERIWRSDFQLTAKIKTFIYSICRYKWLNLLRSKKSFVDFNEYINLSDTGNTVLDNEDPPDHEQLQRAIILLGEPCKGLLIGYYYENLSMEQLATRLNYKNANVVKQQKFRCKDRLKQLMKTFEIRSV